MYRVQERKEMSRRYNMVQIEKQTPKSQALKQSKTLKIVKANKKEKQNRDPRERIM